MIGAIGHRTPFVAWRYGVRPGCLRHREHVTSRADLGVERSRTRDQHGVGARHGRSRANLCGIGAPVVTQQRAVRAQQPNPRDEGGVRPAARHLADADGDAVVEGGLDGPGIQASYLNHPGLSGAIGQSALRERDTARPCERDDYEWQKPAATQNSRYACQEASAQPMGSMYRPWREDKEASHDFDEEEPQARLTRLSAASDNCVGVAIRGQGDRKGRKGPGVVHCVHLICQRSVTGRTRGEEPLAVVALLHCPVQGSALSTPRIHVADDSILCLRTARKGPRDYPRTIHRSRVSDWKSDSRPQEGEALRGKRRGYRSRDSGREITPPDGDASGRRRRPGDHTRGAGRPTRGGRGWCSCGLNRLWLSRQSVRSRWPRRLEQRHPAGDL